MKNNVIGKPGAGGDNSSNPNNATLGSVQGGNKIY